MGKIPAAVVPASDAVIEAIADIETKRRVTEKEAGLAASCNSALRKLHELLEQEQKTLQSHAAGAGHPANVSAVTIEVDRVKRLAGIKVLGPPHRNADPAGRRQESRQKSWQNAQRSPPKNKGRRTMGRAGGR
jgi:ribosomal protein S12